MSFLGVLKTLREGSTVGELELELIALIEKVKATGKTGELVLKLKLEVAEKGDFGDVSTRIAIHDEIKVTEPKPKRMASVFFADQENRLSRRDPRQPALPGMEQQRTYVAMSGGAAQPNADDEAAEIDQLRRASGE